MKRITLYNIFLIFSFVFGGLSCQDALDLKPTNDIVADQAYSTVDGYKLVLSKVYGSFTVTGNDPNNSVWDVENTDYSDLIRCYFNLQELPTDEAHNQWGTFLSDLNYMNFLPNFFMIEALYQRCMFIVTASNEFIIEASDDKLDERGFSDSEKNEIHVFKAEARFARAMSYWILMDSFGNPSFVTDTDPIGSNFFPEQISRSELFEYIEGELLEIQDDVIDARQNEYARVDKGAVWALLARMYLNAEVYTGNARYSDAITYSQKVIEAGYSLMPSYEDLFKADNHINNSEFILPITYDAVNTQNWGGTTFLVCSAHGPQHEEYGISGGGWWGNPCRMDLALKFGDDYQNSDDHRALFGPDVSEEFVWLWKYNNTNIDGSPSLSPNGQFCSIDFPLFRLSEMYLVYAEAVKRGGTGGDKSAEYYVNELRKRAYGDKYPGDLTSVSLDDILDERQRELYWECHRRTDLIRFGYFTSDEYLWVRKGGAENGTGVSEHLNLYPIPASEIIANPSLVQNPGY